MDNSSTTFFAAIKQRIAAREDSEFAQAALRIAMVLSMYAYFLSPYFRSHTEPELLSIIYILTGICVCFCVLILVATIIYTAPSQHAEFLR